MTLVKFNRKNEMPVFSTFSNMLDNLFEREFPDIFRSEPSHTVPAVNVIESKDGFILELAAPGMDKNDFRLKMEHNILSITGQKENNKEENDSKYTRKEFSYCSFERSFTLPNTVNSENINASYENGVLKISLPKKEEAKEKPVKEISIS
jgi:HSP20 family protein